MEREQRINTQKKHENRGTHMNAPTKSHSHTRKHTRCSSLDCPLPPFASVAVGDHHVKISLLDTRTHRRLHAVPSLGTFSFVPVFGRVSALLATLTRTASAYLGKTPARACWKLQMAPCITRNWQMRTVSLSCLLFLPCLRALCNPQRVDEL